MLIDPDISKAYTLPASYYRNPEFFDLLKEKAFTSSWQFIDRNPSFERDRNIIPYKLLPGLLDEPILLTKKAEEPWQCFSNVCTHRGNLLVDIPCNASSFHCAYHGRGFDLDGKICSHFGFEGACDFPALADNLPQLSLENLGPLFFSSIKPKNSFEEIMVPLHEMLPWYPFEKLRLYPNLCRDYDLEANWMLYVDNYLEGFHIPFVHKGLHKAVHFKNYKTTLFDSGNWQIAMAKDEDESFSSCPEAPDSMKNIGALYAWFFPNLMLNFYPWGLSLNLVVPQELNHTSILFRAFVLHEELMGKGAGAAIDKVEMEDEEIVLQVQDGMNSRLYHRGRYSPQFEKGVHQFHSILAQFTDTEQ